MTADPPVPNGLTYGRRFDHSYACAASSPPSTADSPPPLHVRNHRSLPVPRPSVCPPRLPPACHSTTGRIRQNLAAWSALALRPAFLLPDPKCSTYSIGLPDPLRPGAQFTLLSKLVILLQGRSPYSL